MEYTHLGRSGLTVSRLCLGTMNFGRVTHEGDGRRERTVLATKVYGEMGTWPNEGKLSALNIRRALDASLERLQTDYIDLYQFHHVDRATPWEEIWQAIDTAVAQG